MELEIIQHKDILFRDVFRVIKLKNIAWPHPIESQVKWILENQKEEDFHVILVDNHKDLAYLDLCPVKAEIDGVQTEFLGIGNVCTKNQGLGHGAIIISKVNEYLKMNDKKGLLFCKDALIRFYSKYGWTLLSKDRVTTESENHIGVFTMCYNVPTFEALKYSDRMF